MPKLQKYETEQNLTSFSCRYKNTIIFQSITTNQRDNKVRLGNVPNQSIELDNTDKLIELTETTKLYYSYITVAQIIVEGIDEAHIKN